MWSVILLHSTIQPLWHRAAGRDATHLLTRPLSAAGFASICRIIRYRLDIGKREEMAAAHRVLGVIVDVSQAHLDGGECFIRSAPDRVLETKSLISEIMVNLCETSGVWGTPPCAQQTFQHWIYTAQHRPNLQH